MDIETTFNVNIEDGIFTFSVPSMTEILSEDGNSDPIKNMQKILDWLVDIKNVKMNGKDLTCDEVKDIAKMPSRFIKQLIAEWNTEVVKRRTTSLEVSPEKKESTTT